MRLPPSLDHEKAAEIITQKLTSDIPYNCKVELLDTHGGNGWCINEYDKELTEGI
jgi:hypothetical protein